MKLFRVSLSACLALLLFLFLWSFAGPLRAGVVLDEHPRGVLLNATDALQWLPDADGQWTLQQVRQLQQAGRFLSARLLPRHLDNDRPLWFKLQLQQRAAYGDWVLATGTTAIRDVQFYGPFDAAGRALAEPVHTGLSQPYATRPLGSERYVMRLLLPEPGDYTVYVRLQGGSAPIFDISAWDAAQYLQWRQHKRLFDGICYGILLALLVYNLALSFTFRDAVYGLYLGQCLMALLTLASFNGHAAHYLWGQWPGWQERGNVVPASLWLMFGVLFARSFLETRLLPWLDRLLLAGAALLLAVALLGGWGAFALAQAINESLAWVCVLLATGAALVMLRRGFALAWWYLAGQGVLFLLVLGVVLANWKWLDAPFLQANGLQIGVAAEMVVFALALASRVRDLRTAQIELRLHADHLQRAAHTDPLTGLANRAGLARGARRLLGRGGGHALLLLDLDRFKPINDTWGHDAGDAVLRAVAERLQSQLRAGDLCARLGGDEFVILLSQPLSHESLQALVHRLGAVIGAPVDYQGQALQVGASIGIACSPQDGQPLAELMRSADEAMYQAKQRGTGYAFKAG